MSEIVIEMLTGITERLERLEGMLGQRGNNKLINNQILGQLSLEDVTKAIEIPKVKVMQRYNSKSRSYQIYFKHCGKEVYVASCKTNTERDQAIRSAQRDPEKYIIAAQFRATNRRIAKEVRAENQNQREIKQMERELIKREKEAQELRKQIEKKSK